MSSFPFSLSIRGDVVPLNPEEWEAAAAAQDAAQHELIDLAKREEYVLS
jgi:hypothetical protein